MDKLCLSMPNLMFRMFRNFNVVVGAKHLLSRI